MKFHVPGLCELSLLFWNTIHNDLFDRYRFANLRRIEALLWEGDADDERSIIVGEDLPGGEEDDPVLVILESEFLSGMMMFVLTRSMFLAKEPPVALALTEHWRVVDFDDSPGGEP